MHIRFIMTDFIQIKCPCCGAVLKVKHQDGLERASITCPVCKSKARFVDYISREYLSKPFLIEHVDSIQPERRRCPWCGYESRTRTCRMCHSKNDNTNIISIGRVDCDLIVEDESKRVNRHHADIKYMKNGDYFLFYDLSANGTTIDGQRCCRGDIVRIPNDNHDHVVWLAHNPDTSINWTQVKKQFSELNSTIHTHSAISDQGNCSQRGVTAINPNLRHEEETCYSPTPRRTIRTTCRDNKMSYYPSDNLLNVAKNNRSFWSRIFGKKENFQDVYSSVFAPAEVKPKSRMMVQVYLHLDEETEKVKALATEADKNAERRDYIPLQTKLKKGDKVCGIGYQWG